MPSTAQFTVQLAQNVAVLGGLATLHGLILRRWHQQDPRTQLTSGLLFGLTTLVGMQVPLQLLPGVIYDARSVVLTVAGVVLPGPSAGLATAITVAGRLTHGGVGVWAGVAAALTSFAAGVALRRLRLNQPRWRGWRGWLAVALFSHALLLLTQLFLPAAANRAFLVEVMPPLLVVFVPATIALGVLLDLIQREQLTSAMVMAALSGRTSPIAVHLNQSWWLSPAFISALGQHRGAPTAEVAEALLSIPPHSTGHDLPVSSPDGTRHFTVECLPAQSEAGLDLGRLYILQDESAEQAALARARHFESHDALTELLTGRALASHMEASLARDGAVLSVDAPDLRTINGRHGWTGGDLLLQAIANHLQTLKPPEAVAARIVGSEFALWCPGANGLVAAEGLARTLRAGLPLTLDPDAEPHLARIDVGLARFDRRVSPQVVIERAHQALIWAQEPDRTDAEALPWYASEIGRDVDRRIRLLQALPLAIDHDELRLVFQPVWDLADLRLVGAEALLRWRNPELGDVSPGLFVPLAEQAGLMPRLGWWVFTNAVEALERWRVRHRFEGTVAINVSPTQLLQDGFGAAVIRHLGDRDLPAQAVELELTETAVVDHDRALVRSNLAALRAGDLPLVVDDFGTGYSSLLTLQRLHVRKLKIPREFVKGTCDRASDRAIVKATVDMAHALGLTAQGEGVETEAQAAALRELGCDTVQGFLFDRPLEVEAFEARIQCPITSPEDSPRT
ncbi:MAG: EAL domain-containing protein [Myxococcales bacterium]|nr:EAL domain-containing protein [Myxococcales bacterium]